MLSLDWQLVQPCGLAIVSVAVSDRSLTFILTDQIVKEKGEKNIKSHFLCWQHVLTQNIIPVRSIKLKMAREAAVITCLKENKDR